MSLSFWLSLATAFVTAVFAFLVFNDYRSKHRPHLLAWSMGLALYSVGALAQAILFTNFSPFLFKLWYWAGAVVVATWLGQGTLFLLARNNRWAWRSFWLVLALSLLGLPLVFGASLNVAAYQPGVDLTEQFQAIFASQGVLKTLRVVLVILMNTYGTLLLVGGAAYSAWIVWRKHLPVHLLWSNLLIAAGGLLPAMGGFLILLGSPTFKYVGQLLGGILLFSGFLLASQSNRRPIAQPAMAGKRS